MVSYLTLHFALLFLPGLVLRQLIPVRGNPVLLAFGLSYAYAVLFLLLARGFTWSFNTLWQAYVVILLLLVVLYASRKIKFRHLIKNTYSQSWRQSLHIPFFGALLLVLAWTIYLSLVGVYDEVPGDWLRHLEYSQGAYLDINDGVFNEPRSISHLFGKSGQYWYYLHATMSQLSGLTIAESVNVATFANTLTFLLGVYCFTWSLFRNHINDRKVLMCIGVSVAIFFALHFGLNVFSFVRYYSLGPTMMDFVVYFAAISIVLACLSSRGITFNEITIIGILTITAYLLHKQEGLFIYVITLGLTCYRTFFPRLCLAADSPNNEITPRTFITHQQLFISMTVLLIGLFIYSFFNLERHSFGRDGKLLPLENLSPHLEGLAILNPAYQPYRVVTLWGLFVYLLFLFRWRQIRSNAYLVVAMLSPLLTVFNPLFVDLFLRHSTYINLWRFCYLIPLPFVASILFFDSIQRLQQAKARLANSVILVLLIGLLFPIKTPFFTAPYSRLHMLGPVASENSPDQWVDLLEYLRSLENRKMTLTDPVTGYTVSALTKHHSPRYKFFRRNYHYFNFDDYSDKPLAQYKNWLIIVNLRDGGPSRTGEISRHWSDRVLQIHRYYKPQLLQHLQNNPQRFKLLWEADRIKVYRIKK